ncbi:MAG: agmatinase [Candidatus Doudnabacteria bacterium RIFCSPHIGHO2_12_FULL_48_11]|uniref:Agmatinase n=1 Tax=Candidatus Doudnabacteria bacterium RIFCSPHIGHO2_01_FULL_46_24 TaxID=1817825 RepID=A0A1F5NUC6_9BACT|nr:MAG: agmatinase [Candidatus Doudnabacteria bacterium RIFCSPHIGHO2_01_FULL_46_24]OGE96110.1 MAG: agmatinase [Candidatus Doudnabacteria bacterium RIFCSPHIGHO2_12_FULL_48_11]
MGFLGPELPPLPPVLPDYKSSEAMIVPFGFEGTVTFGHGAANGPRGLIEASYQVESFDDELLDDYFNRVKIWTCDQPRLPADPMEACALLKNLILQLYSDNKFPIVIGGEHGISYGFAQAINEKFKDVSVLVFDAHMDLHDRSSGRDFSHAAWLKYSLDLPNLRKATLVGIRNFNKNEYEFWQNNPDRVKVFLAKDRKSWRAEEIASSLGENVYISFDIDCFDMSMIPSTGTPEPGGPMWDDILPIIRTVCAKKNIVGMDLVELSPFKGLPGPDFMAAKLLMKMILYKFCAQKLSAKNKA